ncbi:hypothetical protein MBLNU457_g2857t1 [Dothideomycetes sp. NU457]
MRKLLLTSSQVSVIASSSIVVLFTFALFLAGYTLQQQKLRGLQDVLRPNIPTPPQVEPVQLAKLSETVKASRAFGGRPGSAAHDAYDEYTLPSGSSGTILSTDWTRLAHVQLVTNHHDVCSSIMLLSELHRLKSPAKRVLLFPQAWAMEKGGKKGFVDDPYLDTTRRLLKLGARRYAIELRPISPVVGRDEEDPNAYSLSSLWSLSDYDRVLLLQAPGILLDATPLDALLAYTPAAALATLATDAEPGIAANDIILATPSSDTHRALTSDQSHSLAEITTSFPPLPLSPNQPLLTSIATLHSYTPSDIFNATAWLSNSAYIRFSDPKLPMGPEYDVPWAEKLAARPANKDADWVWTKLYGMFAQSRLDVCGLGLEGWYP